MPSRILFVATPLRWTAEGESQPERAMPLLRRLAFSPVSPYHGIMRIVLDDADLRRLPITIDREIVSGAPVFRNTRVPVEALLTNLEDGMSLDEFLDNFPSVTREQAVQVLEFLNVTLQRLAGAPS
jgi:uncharacterized protein (DUF433 family)